MNLRRVLSLLLVLLPLGFSYLLIQPFPLGPAAINSEPRMVDIGNGQTIEVAPDEVLYTYELSQGPSTRVGEGSPLNVSEYGRRMDSFDDLEIMYDAAGSSTTNATASIPMGPLWEGTRLFCNVSDLQENRTWLMNPGFDTTSDWTLGTEDVGIYTNPLTSTITSGYVRFTMSGEDTGYWFRHDEGDRAYANQTISTNRGEVTWVGVSLDYWVDNNAAWGPNPIGFWELYVQVGHDDNVSNHLWNKQYSDILARQTWYSTGLVEADPSLITSSDLTLQVGMRTTRSFGSRPQINPDIRMDNIRVFMKQRVTPTQVNLEMNGLAVENISSGPSWVWSLGQITETRPENDPWKGGSVNATFTWTPTPATPDPDIDIRVTFSVEVTLFARKLNHSTLYRAEVQSIGDHYIIGNDTQVQWECFYFVAVPNGYSDFYYFNMTKPSTRTIDMVSEPRYPSVDFGYWTASVNTLNVSVYEGVTGTYQNGFWRITGHSDNIIDNLLMWNDTQWVATDTYRANDNIRFRAQLDTAYNGASVTFFVYDTAGELWDTRVATVVGGLAESTDVNLDAYTAEVGQWTVQAFVNDSIGGGPIHNVGMYSRDFVVEHSTDMYVIYPRESVVSWTRNLTYGEQMLLQVRVNDSDNGDLLPGGYATYNWTTGTHELPDMGTGEYSVVLDTDDLGTPGRYLIELTWDLSYYDSISRTFTLNVVEETTLQSSTAPGVNVPRGWNATLHLTYFDSRSQGIDGASIACNWTDSPYYVTPIPGEPGNYTLEITTFNSDLDTYAVVVNASGPFYTTSEITLFVQVRQLFTSVSVSQSFVTVPIGSQESIILTYWDTDHDMPISGAESSIKCNWSEEHTPANQSYTITMISPGEYEIVFSSNETDYIQSYSVVFEVKRLGYQNHTFTVSLEITTHLTTFSLDNPVEPTPYTGQIIVYVNYFDVTLSEGITNTTGDVLIYATSDGIIPFEHSVTESAQAGIYIISIPADQWGSIGFQDITIFANWTGARPKFSNKTLDIRVRISGTPTDLFIGKNPISTPYLENITFTVIYWDVSNSTGITNSTGPYSNNVHLFIEVLTPIQGLNQSVMVITELSNGEYQITFNTTFLKGLVDCDLRIYANWTKGTLPLYENRTLSVTVYSTYRQTYIDWTPIPVTPYDGNVNLTFSYIDVLTLSPIANDTNLDIDIEEDNVILNIFYLGSMREFIIAINTTRWQNIGTFTFHLSVTWIGKPFYQNRTNIAISITIRKRYTELVHGPYEPVQYRDNLTIIFTYNDIDDQPASGITGSDLMLDPSLVGYYTIYDNGDGTYTVKLNTTVFGILGIHRVNASMTYIGSRFSYDAIDFFYLSVIERRTQLTSELPELAPFLDLANITVLYIDDNTQDGIENADIFASCDTAAEILEINVNYWVSDLSSGFYLINIDTNALGTFGPYTISVTANWSGPPYYMERIRDVDIEVSRRPATLTVSKSPLTTPFLNNVTFELSITDTLDGTGITIDKNVLIIKYGAGITLIDSQYSLFGSSGVYLISINSTILTTTLIESLPFLVKFHWGDVAPYYANTTTSTEATIAKRSTQAQVLSTPSAFIFSNATAIIEYSDYLTGRGIAGAIVTVKSTNTSPIESWIIDNSDGTYEIRVNTTKLSMIGRYFFEVNVTWDPVGINTPYYTNITRIEFSIVVNPVSTSLTFILPAGATFYLGEPVSGNITYTNIGTGQGIIADAIGTNWGSLYPTPYTLTPLGNGVYNLTIYTSGLNATRYTFSINATKTFHQTQTIESDILLAAIPVDINLIFTPTNPEWGDALELRANVTTVSGDPLIGASVNITIGAIICQTTPTGPGLYNCTIQTTQLVAGEYTISVASSLLNYESRIKDFQVRIDKVPSKINAALDETIRVNGQLLSIEASYLNASDDSPIEEIGLIMYSWIGGSGILSWDSVEMKYTVQFPVSGVPVGSHQILIQASSDNFKSVTTLLTIEVAEASTEIVPYGQTVLVAISGDIGNITVYLNNTDLNEPVRNATLSFGVGELIENMTYIGNGYYTGLVNTTDLEIRDYALTVSGAKTGFRPASLEFTLVIERIPTEVVFVSPVLIEKFYGENVTFVFMLNDTHNNIGVSGANSSYAIENIGGALLDLGGGSYSLTLNTTIVRAGLVPHDISISFLKERYQFAFGLAKMIVKPISTGIVGDQTATIPIEDDYTQLFGYNDTLHDLMVDGATAIMVWEFGTSSLTALGNGYYQFGPAETNLTSLPIGAYRIRVSITKSNYSRAELIFNLVIRPIATEVRFSQPAPPIYAGITFYVWVTYWDIDHDMAIPGADNTTTIGTLRRVTEDETNYGNGTYLFAYNSPDIGVYEVVIVLNKLNYDSAEVRVTVFPDISPETQALVTTFQYASLFILGVAALGVLWIRVLSIPKLLRKIRSMISKLLKGRIPEPADVRGRRQVLLDYMNEDLVAVEILKTIDDIAISTVDVAVLDVEEQLTQVAEVVGLTEDDLEVLRQDLDKMRPSERAGFIREVLKQERARRAKELAEAERAAEEVEVAVEVEKGLTEEELADLKERLIKMGIEESEADLMVEQAKNLTRAEIDALLDQIGGGEE